MPDPCEGPCERACRLHEGAVVSEEKVILPTYLGGRGAGGGGSRRRRRRRKEILMMVVEEAIHDDDGFQGKPKSQEGVRLRQTARRRPPPPRLARPGPALTDTGTEPDSVPTEMIARH